MLQRLRFPENVLIFVLQQTLIQMKKILLLVAFIVLTTASFAQFSGGVKAGVNFASAAGDDADGYDGRIAYHFGLYGKLPLSDKLSFQPELLFNSVGAKYEESFSDPDFGDVDYKETIRISYLSVPLMLDFAVVDNFSLQVGPQIGFLLAAKGEAEVTYDGGSESDEVDMKDDFKATDFGLNIGAVYSFGKFNAGIRYSLGLASVGDYDDSDIKLNNFQISLGYTLFGGE